ncbi:putative F-box domain-containing protein [Helianthus anomalus]
MIYIPFDMLLFEILTKLNAISIHRFKCVSRKWQDGLSSFEFGLHHSIYVENYLVIYYFFLILTFKLISI